MLRMLSVLGLAFVLALPFVQGDEKTALKSGPQVGGDVNPFHPLNVTGEAAGQKRCLVCQCGGSPVAVVFAREVTPEVTSLIKQIDAASVKNKAAEMASFAVFCNGDEKLQEQLKNLSQKEKLQQTVLAIDNPTGPKGYEIHPDANVTVVFYENFTVKANQAFRKGELNETRIQSVMNDVEKILPKK